MQDKNIDLILDGFRLDKVELYNFGTWDKQIFTFNLNGENALLTGETGSGKSTIVDAISTLLVPSREISYNKAASADKNERTIDSYVFGNYRSSSTDIAGEKKNIALRQGNFKTIILAYFYDKRIKESVTLCQILYIGDNHANVKRIYIATNRKLSIKDDLSDLGSNVREINKTLKKRDIPTYSSFEDYSNEYRRLLGIQNMQAITLFNQAISMKSVEDISSFVRQYMLSYEDAHVNDLIKNYEDLLASHQRVVKARTQQEKLIPIKDNYDKYLNLCSDKSLYEEAKESALNYRAHIAKPLLETKIENNTHELLKVENEIKEQEILIDTYEDECDSIAKAIEQNGGSRLKEIQASIKSEQKLLRNCTNNLQKYKKDLKKSNLGEVNNVDDFISIQNSLDTHILNHEKERDNVRSLQKENLKEITQIEGDIKNNQEELASLLNRKSNIDLTRLNIRDNIVEHLGIDSSELPFVGELIQVKKDEENIWLGALERLLNNFSLSLLVKDVYYDKLAQYVNSHNLKGRLVYFKIDSKNYLDNFKAKEAFVANSVITKLNIKEDMGVFTNYVYESIVKRFNYICTNNIADFRRLDKAITPSGQIKHNKERHEKDDRFDIKDRRKYVMGWSNEDKINHIQDLLDKLHKDKERLDAQYKKLAKSFDDISSIINAINNLKEFKDFNDINVSFYEERLNALESERIILEEENNDLKILTDKKKTLENNILSLKAQKDKSIEQKGFLNNSLITLKEHLNELLDLLANNDKLTTIFSFIEQSLPPNIIKAIEKIKDYNPTSLTNVKNDIVSFFISKIESIDNLIDEIKSDIISRCSAFKKDYVEECEEIVGTDIKSTPSFIAILDDIIYNALPKFEANFKKNLNTHTLNNLATFIARLDSYENNIKKKIKEINESLAMIDYREGTFIELITDDNKDTDIMQFKHDLKECTSNATVDSDNLYQDEERFQKVKAIIESLDTSGDNNNAKKRFTDKVTDVRNRFTFAAREKNRETLLEVDYFKDSDGKSGGQKEKLAYTILATSLAYQFSSKNSATRRAFRFVIIDEAFARGSEESAAFALSLFKILNLQLLVVTPKQKISTIEKFVKSVGYVHFDGMRSNIMNFSIEKYQYLKNKIESLKEQNLDDKELSIKVGQILADIKNNKIKLELDDNIQNLSKTMESLNLKEDFDALLQEQKLSNIVQKTDNTKHDKVDDVLLDNNEDKSNVEDSSLYSKQEVLSDDFFSEDDAISYEDIDDVDDSDLVDDDYTKLDEEPKKTLSKTEMISKLSSLVGISTQDVLDDLNNSEINPKDSDDNK